MNKLFILGLCLVCFIVYFNSLNNSFVLDDITLVTNNPLIKSTKLLPLIFQKNIAPYSSLTAPHLIKMYRPLQVLTYSIDYRIWRLNPLGFHLTNLLLHLFNSILIYYLLILIFNNIKLSRIVSIIFLVHPINTSVVSYISGRADLLVCFFMLFSMISFFKFLKSNLKAYYIMSLVFAMLGLLSRENALALFIFISLVLFTVGAKAKYFLYVLPFVLLDLLYFLFRFFIFGPGALIVHTEFLSLPLRILNFLNIIPRYLLLLIFPLDLHLYRITPFINTLLSIKIVLVIVFILLSVLAIKKFYKNKMLLFSILWFVIGMIPVFIYMDSYGIFLGGAMMAESWLYMSSIGFFIIFTAVLNKLKGMSKVLIISFIFFYSFLTMVNNRYWKNDVILHKNILENTPENNYLRLGLINYYLFNGLYKEAIPEIKKFSIYYPDSSHLYYILGSYYFVTGRPDMAIENYNKVLNKDKNYFYAYYYLSSCYEQLKQLDKALDAALECLKINPYYSPNLIRLGYLYTKNGQFIEARKYYNMALEIDPSNKMLKDKIKNAK